MTLRPYQEEAIECLQASLQARDTALCVLPTGAGKTVVFAEVIRQMQKKTLVLAHRKELLEQARDKITAVYPESDIGIIGYGKIAMEKISRLPLLRACVSQLGSHNSSRRE